MKYISMVSSGNPDKPYFGKGKTKKEANKNLIRMVEQRNKSIKKYPLTNK